VKKSKYTDEQIAFALKQAEVGTPGGGSVPQDGDIGCDVLQLAQEVWRPGAVRAASAEATGGREQQIEAPSCGSVDKAMLQDVLSRKL
jgi:putative transposase